MEKKVSHVNEPGFKVLKRILKMPNFLEKKDEDQWALSIKMMKEEIEIEKKKGPR